MQASRKDEETFNGVLGDSKYITVWQKGNISDSHYDTVSIVKQRMNTILQDTIQL